MIRSAASGFQGEMSRRVFLAYFLDVKLSFVAERPPPPHIAYQELLMAAETSAEYFS